MKKSSALMIVVHYGDAEVTVRLLESLGTLTHLPQLQVLIVNNGPGIECRSRLDRFNHGPLQLNYVMPGSNDGYFGGAAHGISFYKEGSRCLPDWLIVSNNDVVLSDDLFLEKLFRNNPATTPVIAPRIQVGPGKVDQNPFMRHRPGRLRWAQIRFISSSYPVAAVWDWLWRRKAALRSWLAKRRGPLQTSGIAKRQVIYAPHGSFVIFSRTFFEAGGYLDENLFLYGEEISVAEICRSLGLSVIYEPQLCVFHNEHQSTGRMLSRFTFECQKKAVEYLSARYMSIPWRDTGVLRPDEQVK